MIYNYLHTGIQKRTQCSSITIGSVLFDAYSELSITAKIPSECSCLLTIDGEKNIDILDTDKVIITRSKLKLEMLSIHKRNFYKRLNEKLKEREL